MHFTLLCIVATVSNAKLQSPAASVTIYATDCTYAGISLSKSVTEPQQVSVALTLSVQKAKQ